jgi:hypothetical protein
MANNRYSLEAAFNLIDNITKPLDKIVGNTNAVGNAVKDSFAKAQKRVDDFGKTIDKATGALKKTALAAVGVATAAAGAFVVQGVKGAVEFQKSMEKVGAQADLSKEQIAAFSNDLINLSNTTGSAVSGLAEAQLEAISKGVKVADSVQFLEVAVKAANGGFTDTTTVINSLTGVLKSYGLEAKDASKISDQMMAAAKAGGVSFADMSTKLEHVIPVAAKFGVSSEELFASIATLTSQGVPIADAAKKIKSALEKDGKAGLFKTTQGEQFNDMLKRINGSAGATETAFNRVDKTLEEQWGSAINKIKNTGLKLGTALLPAFQKIIDKVSLFVDKFASFDFGPFVSQIEAALDRILSSIDFDALVKGMGDFFVSISKTANCIISLIEVIWKLRTPIIILAGIIKVISGIMFAWALIDRITHSTKLKLIAAIIKQGVVTAATTIKTLASAAAQKAQNLAVDAWVKMKNIEAMIKQGVVTAATTVKTLALTAAQKAQNLAINAWGGIKHIAGMIKMGVVTVATTAKTLALAAAQKAAAIATGIMNGATAAANALFIASPIGWIVLAIGALIAIIIICAKNWDKITAALTIAWEWIKKVAGIIWDGLCNAFNALIGFVQRNSEKVLAFIAIFTGPFGFIISIVKELKDNWGAVVEAFKTDGIIAGLKKLGGVILSGILAPIQGFLEMLSAIPLIGDKIAPAVEKIKEFRNELKGVEIENTIVQNVVPGTVPNLVPETVTQTVNTAAGVVSPVLNNQTINSAVPRAASFPGETGPVTPQLNRDMSPEIIKTTIAPIPAPAVDPVTIRVGKIEGLNEQLNNLTADIKIVENVVPGKINSITTPQINQPGKTTASPSIPSFSGVNLNSQTVSSAVTPATPPMTTAEQYYYSEKTSREQVEIGIKTEPGTTASVTRRPRSPNVKVATSGGNNAR